MKRKFITIALFVVCVMGNTQTKLFEQVSLELGSGYTNYDTFAPEAAIQTGFTMFKRPSEIKVGINYHTFDGKFKEMDDLNTESVGLFTEVIIYPFHKYFFTGIRWDLVTFNWFTNESLDRIESNPSSIFFTGTNIYAMAGVNITLSKRLGFKLSFTHGVQQYKVSDGTFSSGSYVSDGTLQENYAQFVYQINAGLTFRLK